MKDHLIESLRKNPIADLQRAFETAPSGLSKSIAKEKFHQQAVANNLISTQNVMGGASQAHKMNVHVLSNKIGGQGGLTHSLKKSASTRQVVNLLDLQQVQPQHVYAGNSSKAMSQVSQ